MVAKADKKEKREKGKRVAKTPKVNWKAIKKIKSKPKDKALTINLSNASQNWKTIADDLKKAQTSYTKRVKPKKVETKLEKTKIEEPKIWFDINNSNIKASSLTEPSKLEVSF